jgi:hypothetical protein
MLDEKQDGFVEMDMLIQEVQVGAMLRLIRLFVTPQHSFATLRLIRLL